MFRRCISCYSVHMQIKDAMSRPAIVISPEASVYDALELMKKEKIRRLPVVRDGRLAGIVTDRDIRDTALSDQAVLPERTKSDYLRDIPISRVMTQGATIVSPDDPVECATLLMKKYKIGGMPVVDNGRVVGVITESDIFRIFSTIFGAEPGFLRVTIEDSDYSRNKITDIFLLMSDKIQTLLFSPEGPDIVIVFRVPNGKSDGLPILEKLAKSGVELVDWELFEPERQLSEAEQS